MRIGKKVWLAKRVETDNSEIPTYEKPIELVTRANYLTVMPSVANGLEVLKGGENLYSSWNATANSMYFDGVIKAGDVMWLDGDKPIESVEEEYGYGASATAEVKSALEVNFSIAIKLERRQNQVLK